MKIIKTLFAVAAIAGLATTAHASTTYVISGALTGNNASVIYSPINPSFIGAMSIDLVTAQVDPGAFQFAIYSDYVPSQGATYTVPNETIAYDLSSGSWSGSILHFSGINYIDHQPAGSCIGNCTPSLDGHTGFLSMDLTFSDDHNFTGVATALDSQYGYSRTFSFSGTAVPVPAAAWLFGSSLIGLVGAARRKASAA